MKLLGYEEIKSVSGGRDTSQAVGTLIGGILGNASKIPNGGLYGSVIGSYSTAQNGPLCAGRYHFSAGTG
ncbi:MAG: hypothetical protein E7H57_03145 [Pantoea sp.]|nr:hypothetical protein [Pantoea sp.]